MLRMSKKFRILLIMVVVVFGIGLDYLSQRINRLENELKTTRDILMQLFTLESKVKTVQNILYQEGLPIDRKIQIFRSSQNKEAVSDATIANIPKETDFNWGGRDALEVGRDSSGNLYRILIKFNEIKKGIPKDIRPRILAATVYLKQQGNSAEENPAFKQVLNLYEIKKNWGEGNKIGAPASPGESSWIAAAQSQVNWEIPGCSGKEDLDKILLVATTGATVNSAGDGWIGIHFTPEGIFKLQRLIHDPSVVDQGFLLQFQDDDTVKNNLMSLYSSEFSSVSDRPYIEIIYVSPNSSG